MTLSSSPSSKTFFIENLGCSKNQVDAEVIIASLTEAGWKRLCEPDEASLIVVNTCGFIQSAKEESIRTIFDYRQAWPDKKILAAGCFAQRYSGKLLDMIPELDGVFGNRAPGRIPEVTGKILAGEKPVFVPSVYQEGAKRKEFLGFKGSAFVKIAEGCSNRCTFCAIPVIKGELYSRSREDVLEEIRGLRAQGIFEINLVAQDLANFGKDRGKKELKALLQDISALPGEFWLRLLYIHPDHFPMEVLPIIREDPRILPYFDIPFQHGDARILKRMGRKGNAQTYIALVERLRREFPEGVIRSTILCGFPGENRRSFGNLLSFLREARLDWVGFFSYSREEETPAWHFQGALRTRVAAFLTKRRVKRLEEVQEKITEERMERFQGKILPLLVEEEVAGESLYLCRSAFQAPEVDGLVVLRGKNLASGQVVAGRIIKRNGLDLEAVLVKEDFS